MRLARTVVVSLMTLTALGCGPTAERTLLTRFFAASRLRDLTALAGISTVVFEPSSDGIVTSFEIVIVRERAGSKEIWLTAPVKLPDGRTMVKDLVATIQGGMVTAISEPPAVASTPPR
jgi:hypothetical protein